MLPIIIDKRINTFIFIVNLFCTNILIKDQLLQEKVIREIINLHQHNFTANHFRLSMHKYINLPYRLSREGRKKEFMFYVFSTCYFRLAETHIPPSRFLLCNPLPLYSL
jgi:hypothetical protein